VQRSSECCSGINELYLAYPEALDDASRGLPRRRGSSCPDGASATLPLSEDPMGALPGLSTLDAVSSSV
jgi:hypothetical protein